MQEFNWRFNMADSYQNPTSPSTVHVRLVFALVIAAAFLDIVDFSIIQVALPTIRTQFLISLADSQWIVGAYGLTLAGFLLLSGRAGDIYGQKRFFVIGVSLFTISSMAAGIAPSFLFLVVSRAIQGIGAAITTVTALSIFAIIFPEGKRRARALGILVAVLSAGFAAGSITGGVLTAAFGWRSVMFVNVPIGAAVALLSVKFLPDSGERLKARLDLPGGLAVTGGTMLLVYALSNAANDGFLSALTLLPLAVSVLVFAGFIVIESRSKSPLMPLMFLRRGAVLTANVLGLILASASGGLGFILTIYMQQILGYSALSAGLAFLPAAVVFLVVGGWGSAWLLTRLSVRRILLISMGLVIFGNVLLTQISVEGNYLGIILPGMMLWSFGASIGFPVLYLVALSGTKHGEEGLASGLITTSQRVGFPLGLAVLLAVAGATSPAGVSAAAIVTGFQYAFVASTVLSIIGLAIAFRVNSKGESAKKGSELSQNI